MYSTFQVMRRVDSRFSCSMCSKIFSIKQHLTRHVNFDHSNSPRFTCDICRKDFLRKDSLDRHMKLHASKSQREYACPICQRPFSRKENMVRHLKTHKGSQQWQILQPETQERREETLKQLQVNREQLHASESNKQEQSSAPLSESISCNHHDDENKEPPQLKLKLRKLSDTFLQEQNSCRSKETGGGDEAESLMDEDTDVEDGKSPAGEAYNDKDVVESVDDLMDLYRSSIKTKHIVGPVSFVAGML